MMYALGSRKRMWTQTLFSLAVAVFCPLPCLPQASLPPAPGRFTTVVSATGGRFTEPSIAVDPNNPNRVVAVFQGGAEYQGIGNAAYSTDGGRSFHMAGNTAPTGWRVAGDVTTTFDNKGRAFLCYLAFDRLGTTDYWAHNAGRNGIFVKRSPDGGKTWEQARAIKVFPTGKEPRLAFEDEPRIFADNIAGSPFEGNLYAGWVEWQLDRSIILFSRSSDDGMTWSKPIQISTHAGLPRDDNGSLGGYVQAVRPDGTIYAAWHDGDSLAFTESRDGGKTFLQSRAVLSTGPPYFGDVPGVSRVEGFPQIAVGEHARATELYVTWSDYRNGDIDVFFSRSLDRGRTWSKATRVNDDALHDGADQFYQWMTVDAASGAIYVQFYDRRDDPENRRMGITLARSTDGGDHFQNYSWSSETVDGLGAFLGDYTWLTAVAGHVYGIWTEAVAASQGQKSASQPARPTTVIHFGSANFSGVP